jgi:hypothetical protein
LKSGKLSNEQAYRENKNEIEFLFDRQNQNSSLKNTYRIRSRSPIKKERVGFNLKFDIEIENENIISVKVQKVKDEIKIENDSGKIINMYSPIQ